MIDNIFGIQFHRNEDDGDPIFWFSLYKKIIDLEYKNIYDKHNIKFYKKGDDKIFLKCL